MNATTSADTAAYVKTYTLDNGDPDERARLADLEAAWDPGSRSHFQRLGLREGHRVLMVAGGGGGMVEWVAQVVGPTGSVLATDLDPRFLHPLAERYPQLTVAHHNVVTEELPVDDFDFVHTRLLVAHLPEREAVIAKMAAATKPGGWLLIEDADSGSRGVAYPDEVFEKALRASYVFLDEADYDSLTGRRLPILLRGNGLADVDAFGTTLTIRGNGATLARWYKHTFLRYRERFLARGLLSAQEIDYAAAKYDDPDFDMLAHTMVSAWGRRPVAGEDA
ncbi:methyltransferase [Nocardia takedensis]